MLRPELDKPFLCAAGRGDLGFLQKHTKDEIGKDLIHLALKEACFHKRRDVVSWLMGMGAWNLEPGLMGACQGGDISLVKMMIQDGAVNWTEGYAEALLEGHQEIIELFEALNDEAKATSAWLPMFYSFVLDGKPIEKSMLQVQEYPVKDYPVINHSKCLERLCEAGRSDLVEILLAKKDIPIKTKHLRLACGSGNLNLVQSLLNKGTDFYSGISLYGAIVKQQLDVIRLLLAKGAKPSKSEVQKAAETGNYQITELLCSMLYPKVTNGEKRKHDQNSFNSREATPSEILGSDIFYLCGEACRGGNLKIIEMILTEYGAEDSALHLGYAYESGNKEVIDYVLARKNSQKSNGLMMGAIQAKNVQLVETIFEEIENEEGQPVHVHQRYIDWILKFAIDIGDLILVEKMLAKGAEIDDDDFLNRVAVRGWLKMVHFIFDRIPRRVRRTREYKNRLFNTMQDTQRIGRYDASLFLLEHAGCGVHVPYSFEPLRATGSMNLMLYIYSPIEGHLRMKYGLQRGYPYSWKNFTRNIARILSDAVEQETSKSLPSQLLHKIMRFANIHDLPREFMEKGLIFDAPPAILNGHY